MNSATKPGKPLMFVPATKFVASIGLANARCLAGRWVNMRSIVLLTVCLFSPHLSAQCPDWKPDLRFELDGASEANALAWLGGWSSAVYEAARAGDISLNVPDCGYLISKQIVEILNSQFEGKTVSAEQASAYIWPRLKERFSESPSQQLQPIAESSAD